jgi:hypothetical protein
MVLSGGKPEKILSSPYFFLRVKCLKNISKFAYPDRKEIHKKGRSNIRNNNRVPVILNL